MNEMDEYYDAIIKARSQEDDDIILKGYAMIKECIEDYKDVSKKTSAAVDYCSERDFSVDGISYAKRVDDCYQSMQEMIAKLEEFAESLISVVDKDKLQEYREGEANATHNKTFFPQEQTKSEQLQLAKFEQNNQELEEKPTLSMESITQDQTQELKNKMELEIENVKDQMPEQQKEAELQIEKAKNQTSDIQKPSELKINQTQEQSDLVKQETSQTTPSSQSTPPSQPTAPTGPNDPRATQVGPNGEQPPSPPPQQNAR